jgi:hypothetical protein
VEDPRQLRRGHSLLFVDDEGYRYVAVFDPDNAGAWMGVNEQGFGILNALSSDLEK